jgi:nitroreductase
MENNILNPLIKNRYSPRAYSSKPLSAEVIESLFEAARWAASSRNTQPWRFIYATPNNSVTWNRLFDCLIPFNQEWVTNAQLLVLALVQKTDPHRKNVAYDLGLAMGNLSVQASHLGLYTRNMGGFASEKAIGHFGIPEIYEPIIMLSAGYLGNEDALSEHLKVPKGDNRSRRLLDQLIFDGDWSKMR